MQSIPIASHQASDESCRRDDRRGRSRDGTNAVFSPAARGTAAVPLEWDGLLTANAAEARSLLDRVLAGRIVFRAVPSARGRDRYKLTVPIAFDRVLSAVLPELAGLQDRMASPMPAGWNHVASWLKRVDALRVA